MPQPNATGRKPAISFPKIQEGLPAWLVEGQLTGQPLIVDYAWLEANGIFSNRMDAQRKRAAGFPAPLQLSPNRIAWRLAEVVNWLDQCPRRMPKTGAKTSMNTEVP